MTDPAVTVEELSSHPRIVRLSALLTEAECDALVQLGEPRLRPSEMGDVALTSEDDAPAVRRTSHSMSFDVLEDATNALLGRLRQRWADAAGLPMTLAEDTQLTRYAAGEAYGLHLDASEEVLRNATVLTYLADGFGGGETYFPRVPASAGGRGVMRPLAKLAAAGVLSQELAKGSQYCSDAKAKAILRVPPRKGDAILFFPLRPDGEVDLDVVHGGCAVSPGELGETKWIAQQWFRFDRG